MSMSEDQRRALDEHNSVRRRYGCPDLQWDDSLASDAYSWATKLVKDDKGLAHDPNLKNQAENLAQWNLGYKRGPYERSICALGTNQWYDKRRDSNWGLAGDGEEDKYFNNPSDDYLTWGHFAIIASAGHTKMGISYQTNPFSKNFYIVARYSGSFQPPAFDPKFPTKRIQHPTRK